MKKLRIVEPHHELSGKFPRRFEQAVRRAKVGDETHRGSLFTGTSMARRALAQCLPPSASARAGQLLSAAEDWAKGSLGLREVKRARAELYESAPGIESSTLRLLRSAPSDDPSAFDAHIRGVVHRYVGLSVHHAINAALHCHDGVLDPLALLEVSKEVAAAVAYRNVGLGPARSIELRDSARQNARWEADRVEAVRGHTEEQLMIQLLHEYLGVHWKNHVDAQRLYLEQFLGWAIP